MRVARWWTSQLCWVGGREAILMLPELSAFRGLLCRALRGRGRDDVIELGRVITVHA